MGSETDIVVSNCAPDVTGLHVIDDYIQDKLVLSDGMKQLVIILERIAGKVTVLLQKNQ